jgi:hypothetical protein
LTDSFGNFSIDISPSKKFGNWLPSKEGGRFNLVLRIYNGDKQFVSELQSASLPSIKKKGDGK